MFLRPCRRQLLHQLRICRFGEGLGLRVRGWFAEWESVKCPPSCARRCAAPPTDGSTCTLLPFLCPPTDGCYADNNLKVNSTLRCAHRFKTDW